MAKRPAAKSDSAGKPAKARKGAGDSLLGSTASAPAAVEPLYPPPISLAELLGQDRAVANLLAAIKTDRVHHAWIFHGPFGVGKLTAAIAFGALLLDPTAKINRAGELEYDKDGPIRELLEAGTHPDLHVITKELARFSEDKKIRDAKLSTIPKDVIDTHLLRPATLAPAVRSESRASKVFIVDEAELLDRSPTNAPTQNALLKTMEEPPEGTVIILVTSAEEQLLPTIRSRCQRVPFVPLSDAAMEAWLKRSKLEMDADEKRFYLGFAAGSPGALLRAKEGGMHAWQVRLSPSLAKLTRGEYAVELAPTMASLVDEWAESWVKSHDNASKEAANRAGADWMLRLIADHFRAIMRMAAQQGAAGAPRVAQAASAMESICEAERRLDSHLQGVFVYEALVADATAIFAGEAAAV